MNGKEKTKVPKFEPLHLTVAGEGGSGKSMVVKTIVSVIKRMLNDIDTALVAAPTGAASFSEGWSYTA